MSLAAHRCVCSIRQKIRLRFCARVRGFSGSELADRLDHALGLTTLQGVRLQPVETLSKGFKRRVGLAHVIGRGANACVTVLVA